MKTFLIACFLFALTFLALPALAQNPTVSSLSTTATISPGELTPTPEMWFYEQYRQEYQDPKTAIHNRAVFRAEYRERRIAAMKWFGFSSARPRTTSDPWHAGYSRAWSPNDTLYPFRWSGFGSSATVVQRDESTTRAY